MLNPADAAAAIRAHIPKLPIEQRSLAELTGAILREPITLTRDQPPFHRVTMDGIACVSAVVAHGVRRLRIAGTQAAGAQPLRLSDRESCIEVMTGAVLPEGCDCVIPVERLQTHEGLVQIDDDVHASEWLNVHTRGLDARAEQRLLEPGVRIGPTEIALIATAGRPSVSVSREPSLCLISTGDELIEPGQPVRDWQIYRSNVYAVLASLRARGFARVEHDHLPDDLHVLRTRLRAALEQHDVLVLSGGVSMGQFDFIPQVMTELGVQCVFHKVAQRPGKPLWFGTRADGKAVFALPGNPVSTLVCLVRYVVPGLAAAAGFELTAETAALAQDFEVRPALTVFVPVKRTVDAEARLWAEVRPTQGSGDFISLLETNGFVELPPGPQSVKRGTLLPFFSWT